MDRKLLSQIFAELIDALTHDDDLRSKSSMVFRLGGRQSRETVASGQDGVMFGQF
jgi:hypothetical protein